MAHVRRESSRIDARCDHQDREGMPCLVERDRLKPRSTPRPLRALCHGTTIEWGAAVRPREEQIASRAHLVLEEDVPEGRCYWNLAPSGTAFWLDEDSRLLIPCALHVNNSAG